MHRNHKLAVRLLLESNKALLPSDAILDSLNDSTKNLGGLSGDSIYFLKDSSGHNCLVIKEFLNKSRFDDLKAEITAMKKLETLQLKYSAPITRYFHQNDNNNAFLAMDVAKGKPLKHYIEQVNDEKSSDHQYHMQTLTHALDLYGKAMAELNSKNSRPIVNIDPRELTFFTDKITKIHASLIANHRLYDTLDLHLLDRYIKTTLANFLKNPGHYGYTQGDPNPGNFILDLENDRVTMLDNAHMAAKWMDSEGNPKGFPANEYIEAMSCLQLVSRRLDMSEELNIKIQAAFRESYLQSAPQHFATKEALSFFNLFWMFRAIYIPLREVENYSGRREFKPHPELLNNLIVELKQQIGQGALPQVNDAPASSHAPLMTTSLEHPIPMQDAGLKLLSGNTRLWFFNNSQLSKLPIETTQLENSYRY